MVKRLLLFAPRAFVTSYLFVVFIPITLCLGLVILVDPFRYFEIVDIQGFNHEKLQATHQIRLTKAHQICNIKPANIIFGSSRAELGLDPEHKGWDRYQGETYNASMAGIGTEELFNSFKHAYFASPNFKLAIIALDFYMFNAYREAVVFGTEVINFDINRLVLTEEDSCQKSFKYDLDYFLGNKAIKAALNTIRDQNSEDRAKHELYLRNGMRHQTKNALYVGMPKTGHRAAFKGNESYFVKKVWRAGPENRYCFEYENIDTFAVFQNLLEFSREKDIEIKFFMTPMHARTHITLQEAGLWGQYLIMFAISLFVLIAIMTFFRHILSYNSTMTNAM